MPSDDFWGDLPLQPGAPKRTPPPTRLAASPEPSASPAPTKATRPHVARRIVVSVTTVFLMLIGAIGGTGLALWQGTTVAVADRLDDRAPVVFAIPRGRTTLEIAHDLVAAHLIVSEWPFVFAVAARHAPLRAGTYVFSPSLTIAQVVTELSNGNIAVNRVTIPEGWRLEQIADLLAAKHIATRADFLAAATYDPVRYTLPSGITRQPGETLEGLLFPDTYEFPIGVTSKNIVRTMLETFTAKTTDLQPTYAQVILASIVEREAKQAADRPLIAGVYTNRLANNMKLEADPTVQYGADTLRNAALPAGQAMAWWAPITADDYQRVASLWNTYRVSGLPPTPIANPGFASLAAAVHPAVHSDYYFFTRPDGTAVYSKTKAEHDQARAAQ